MASPSEHAPVAVPNHPPNHEELEEYEEQEEQVREEHARAGSDEEETDSDIYDADPDGGGGDDDGGGGGGGGGGSGVRLSLKPPRVKIDDHHGVVKETTLASPSATPRRVREVLASSKAKMSNLDEDCLRNVFRFLHYKYLHLFVSFTCAKWRKVIRGPQLYRNLDLSKSYSSRFPTAFKNVIYKALKQPFFTGIVALKLGNMKFGKNSFKKVQKSCPNLVFLDCTNCKRLRPETLTGLWSSLRVVILRNCWKLNSMSMKHVVKANMTDLERLDLSFGPWVDDKALTNLSAGKFPSIKDISFDTCPNITTAGIKAFFSVPFASLLSLDLMRASHLNDDALLCIAKFCPSLVKLILGWCLNISDPGVNAIVAACKNLEFLDLSVCRNLTSACVVGVGERLPLLHHLDIGRVVHVDDRAIKAIVKSSGPHLRYFNVRETKISDSGLKAVALACPSISRLNLRGCNDITDTGLGYLTSVNCPRLDTLKLSYCEKITSKGVTTLLNEAQVSSLDIRGSPRVRNNSPVQNGGRPVKKTSMLRLQPDSVSRPSACRLPGTITRKVSIRQVAFQFEKPGQIPDQPPSPFAAKPKEEGKKKKKDKKEKEKEKK